MNENGNFNPVQLGSLFCNLRYCYQAHRVRPFIFDMLNLLPAQCQTAVRIAIYNEKAWV